MPISNSISAQPASMPHRAGDRVVLSIKGLRKAFGGQVVLDDVDADLKEGEVVLLRGDNGSGKTTLLNILTGNLEPDSGTIHLQPNGQAETFRFPRKWWEGLNPFDHFTPERVAREAVCRTWQDVRLFPTLNLRDNIAFARSGQPGENPIRALFASGASARFEARISGEADSLLGSLNLSERATSSGDMVSLGQSKRVAIARAVAAGAKILFFDEPLAGLDRQGIADVVTLLDSLVREHRLTLVIVEHIFNQPHLEGLVTTDWLLENGRLQRIANNSYPAAAKQLQAPRPAWFADFAGDSDGTVIRDESLPRGATLTRIHRAGCVSPAAKAVLEIRSLIVKRGVRTVIGSDSNEATSGGFDLTLHSGEIAVLQAPNGWGKSTLVAAICGLTPIESGQILLSGQPLESLPTWERVGHGLSVLLSDRHTFPNLLARDSLKLAGKLESSASIDQMAGRPSSALSGGQKQRLALIGARRPNPTGLQLLDEPFSMLDRAAIHEAIQGILSTPSAAVLIVIPSSTSQIHLL